MLLAAEGTMLLLITKLNAEIALGYAKGIFVAPPFLFHFWGSLLAFIQYSIFKTNLCDKETRGIMMMMRMNRWCRGNGGDGFACVLLLNRCPKVPQIPWDTMGHSGPCDVYLIKELDIWEGQALILDSVHL